MLSAWRASPSRFREDANAEDDLALGGYRDRLVVELAQNASDAAGSGGRLALTLDGDLLTATNTGAPLDAAGVQALATLRASAKRTGGTVGRFGVGFAAVAAVSDEVVVASGNGGVLFSRARTRAAVAAEPALAAELAQRGGRVPLLRLPWPVDEQPADTVVRVRLRPGVDVQALLAQADDALLLVLPGLEELAAGDRVLRREADGDDVLLGGRRWRVARTAGDLDPQLLASGPAEERGLTRWQVVWAVPVDAAGLPQPLPGQTVRAPTPTDDPLSAPAVLSASLPLGPDRRRVRPGPLAQAVLAGAAQALAGLLARLADDPSRLAFVPGPLAAGEVDALLGSEVLRVLRSAPVLAGGRRPADAVLLDGASDSLVVVLSDLLPGLLPAPWSARRWASALARLGVRRLDLPGLTELLAGVARPPSWWRELYAALPPDRDALGALPVPTADGRLAPSPRGLVLDAPGDLTPLGLRSVHPDAAHPLLLRLGAVQAQPRDLLEDPRVRAAVESADAMLEDGEDLTPLLEAVLALVGGAALRPGELPWLAALPLPDADGEWRPAGDLLLPGGPLARVVDTAAGFGVVAPGTASDDVLAAVGVLRGFAVVGPDDQQVDGAQEWLTSLAPGEEPGRMVRDLDLVRPEAWPEALELLRRDGLDTLPYVQWELARLPVLAGRRPRELCLPGSDLAGLYDEAPWPFPGVRTCLAEVLADDPDDVLDRLADPGRELSRAQVRAVHAALALAAPDVEPPELVRTAQGLLPAEDAVVVDRPDLLPLVAPYAVVPVPLEHAAALADLLDVALASELVTPQRLPGPGLRARTAGGQEVQVDWLDDGRTVHSAGVRGQARAQAWRGGAWERRHAIEARLLGRSDPAEDDLDPV